MDISYCTWSVPEVVLIFNNLHLENENQIAISELQRLPRMPFLKSAIRCKQDFQSIHRDDTLSYSFWIFPKRQRDCTHSVSNLQLFVFYSPCGDWKERWNVEIHIICCRFTGSNSLAPAKGKESIHGMWISSCVCAINRTPETVPWISISWSMHKRHHGPIDKEMF